MHGNLKNPGRRLQFSVLILVGVLGYAVIGVTGLIRPSAGWTVAVTNVTVLALVVAALAAVFRYEGQTRVVVGGFALCGWAYLLATWMPDQDFSTPYQLQARSRTSNRTYVCGRAFLRELHDFADSALPDQTSQTKFDGLLGPFPFATGWLLKRLYEGIHEDTGSDVVYARFMCIGHCLWAFSFGIIGGLLARYLYATKMRGRINLWSRSGCRTSTGIADWLDGGTEMSVAG